MSDLRQRIQQSLSGTYTVERELGGGGMSRVFVADEHRLGRKVVVKVLAPDLAAGLSAERFQREIRVAASLQQANIVPVLSAGETVGLPYYTMPFVEGESLRSRLRNGPLAIADTVGILRDVARALAYAHERGVVHRDIKPDNILLSGATAVVTDFGIAKAVESARRSALGARPSGPAESREPRAESTRLTAMGTSIGTPAYMAPEQAAGDPDTDARADLYAFGCTAYELLAGRPPFHDMPPHRIVAAHMGTAPQPVSELRLDTPPALARLVMRCLAKDPAERPASAGELLRELEATASGASSGVTTAPTLVPARGTFLKALAIYAVAWIVVALVARAVVNALALPDWVFPGTLVVMALGLPVVLATGWSHWATRQAVTRTPTLTPGGTVAPATHGTLANLAVKASPHLTWRRALRGGLVAMAAFVLLVAGWMSLRALGIGPAGSLFAAGKLTEDARVLVAGFDAPASDSSLGATIAEAVRTNLSQSRAVHMVPTSEIVAALGRMKRPADTRLSLDVARELAQREGIEAIVAGSVAPAGTGYIISTRLVASESGDELAAFREAAKDAGEIIPAVDRLTRKLRGKMGESLRTVRDTPPLQQVTTGSLGALRSFTRALHANDVEGDYTKAVTLFEEAIAQDSTFAIAWLQLTYSMLGARRPQAQRDSAMAMAFRLRERLPERERWNVEGAWYNRGVARDRRRAIAAFERAVQLDSTNADALNSLAIVYWQTRDYEKSARTYRRALVAEPSNGIIRMNLAGTLLNMGRLQEADSVVRAIRADGIPFPTARREFEILMTRGEWDAAESLARSIADTAKGIIAVSAAEGVAELAILRGRLREAAERIAQIDARAAMRGDTAHPIELAVERAFMDGWLRGNAERALTRLDADLRARPLESFPVAEDRAIQVAQAYAILGAPQKGRAVLSAHDARITDPRLRLREQAQREGALGDIALAEGKVAEAIAAYRRSDFEHDGLPTSCAVCLPAFLGLAFDRAGMPDSARVHLERYLTSPANGHQFIDRWLRAPSLKRLGELYENSGDLEKAALHYERFVELWEKADPDLQPQVREVRERLARMERAKQ